MLSNVAQHQVFCARSGVRWIASVIGTLAILLTLSTRCALAQLDQGSISGVVQDSSGRVIPGADITLTNKDTGLLQHQKSNGSGFFVFSPVKIGHYSVTATAAGFQTIVQENLQLDLDQKLNVALTLKPGTVTETVTVSSAPPLLQNEESSVSQVIDTRTINNTPLAERNWVYMAQLSTGVVPSYGTRGGAHGDYEANGQRAEQNDYLLDGVDNNVDIVDYMNGSMYAVAPPPDALSEFKLDTADYSAQYGHSAGSVLNVAIKSGTNQIHGDVWEYNRNTFFNAEQWNANPLLPIPPVSLQSVRGHTGVPDPQRQALLFWRYSGHPHCPGERRRTVQHADSAHAPGRLLRVAERPKHVRWILSHHPLSAQFEHRFL